MSLSVGQKAPDFKLIDTDKNVITLDQLKGKNVVLFFFPAAWTGTCTKEVCAVSEDFKQYEKLNAVPLGVSVDMHWALKRFSEDYKLGFKLVSDFNKDAIKAYDVVQHDFSQVYHDVARRSTFVIDKEGIIRFIEVLPTAGDFPNMEAIKNAIAQLN